MEIEVGILKLRREGKNKRVKELQVIRQELTENYSGRLLPMDQEVAIGVAHLTEVVRPMVLELEDLIVAATAKVRGFIVLTRNVRHFLPTGVFVMDPLVTLPPDVVS